MSWQRLFDKFRVPGPAVGAARLCGLILGVTLTWASAAIGLACADAVLLDGCRDPRPKKARMRLREIQAGITQYRIEESRCPTWDDLIGGKWVSRQNTDPWGTRVVFWCHGEDIAIVSAGPDKRFNTDDDVRNEQ